MGNNISIEDLESDMESLGHDYEHYMSYVYSNYPYDWRMESASQLKDTIIDMIYLNQEIIKKKHC